MAIAVDAFVNHNQESADIYFSQTVSSLFDEAGAALIIIEMLCGDAFLVSSDFGNLPIVIEKEFCRYIVCI
jgi:hypothetical protein